MSDLADYRHSQSTRRLLRSLAAIVCPPELAELRIVDDVIDDVELGMRSMPPLVRLALVSGLTSYDLAAIARYGRRASRLSPERAKAYFGFWRHGLALQREFIKGIKGIIAMSYFEQPAVLAGIGYTPHEWVARVDKRRLEVYADDIARHEATIFEADPIPLPSEVEGREQGTVRIGSNKKSRGAS
jgi:hypothetical protein